MSAKIIKKKEKVEKVESWNGNVVRSKAFWHKGEYLLCRKFGDKDVYERELAAVAQLRDTGVVLNVVKVGKNGKVCKVIFNINKLKPLRNVLSGLDKAEKKVLVKNIVLALEKIHKRKFIHRNLKPEHIFVDSHLNIKFGGLESSISEEELSQLYGVTLSENFENYTFASIMPIEATNMTEGYPITTQIDIWSLGFIIHEIISSIPPNYTNSHHLTKAFQIRAEDFWNNFLSKIFISNPEKRATCKDLLSMLEAPESQKKSKSFLKNFKTSTKSWVKELTEDKNSSFDNFFVDKLLKKARKKPKKIEKFFKCLFELDIYKPKVCIKSLVLLHVYMNHCGGIGNFLHCVSFVVKTESLWKNSQSPKLQKYFSATSQRLVLSYCSILKVKYEFFNKFQCFWNEVETEDKNMVSKILEFYEDLNKFSGFVLSLDDLSRIYKDLLQNVIKEQELLNVCIEKLLLQVCDSSLSQEFSEQYQVFISGLHNFYARYPLVSVDLQGSHLSRSRRTIPTKAKNPPLKVPILSKSLIIT